MNLSLSWRFLRLAVLPVLAALLVAAGCSASEPTLSAAPDQLPLVEDGVDDDDGQVGNEEPTPSVVPPASNTPVAAPDAVAAPVLRVGLLDQPVLNLAEASLVSPADMIVADLLYDGLTKWNQAQDTWSMGLATEVTGNADSTLWTFVLPEDLTFANGDPLVAVDVERSLEAALANRTAIPGQRLEMVVGMDGDDVDLDGIRAVNPTTLEIELTRPFGGLPAALSSPVFGVLPQGDVVPAAAAATDGSGPMRLVSNKDQVLSFFPVSGAAASFPTVELHIFDTQSSLDAAFAAGQLELAFGDGADAAQLTERNVQMHYALNVQSWKLSDNWMRQAVLAAIDRDALVANVFDGAALPLETFGDFCAASCEADVALAATALGNANAGGELPTLYVDFIADDTGVEQEIAQLLAEQLLAAGIPAEAREHTLLEFVTLVGNGEHEMYRAGWTGLFPSDHSRLSPYLPGGNDNVSGYSSETFAQFMTAAQELFDGSTLYAQAQKTLTQDHVVAPLVTLTHNVMVAETVTGLQLRIDGTFNPAQLELG